MKLFDKFSVLLRVPENHKNPEALVNLRIRKLGYGANCSRCLGNGRHGNFGTCFKCGGTGRESFRLTKALYEKVEQAVNEGRLDTYLLGVEIEAEFKRLTMKLERQVFHCEIAKDYSKAYKAESSGVCKVPKVLFELQKENNGILRELDEIKRAFNRMNTPKGLKETPESEREELYNKLKYQPQICIAKNEELNENWREIKEAFGAGIFDNETEER